MNTSSLWMVRERRPDQLLQFRILEYLMVGPKYHRPVVQTPSTFRDLADNPQIKAQSASYADLPWWLEIATERINAARAQLAVTRSSLFPQVGAGANFNGGKENNFQAKYNFLTLLGDAAFQLDFYRPIATRQRGCSR